MLCYKRKMKLRAAIIVDQLKVSKWMIDALNEASDQLEIIYVLNCVDSKTNGSIFMENAKGPHSLNLSPDLSKIVVDYYENKFSFLAGFRRLKAKVQAL